MRMRCNFLRFQAQYLRRIPIPAPMSVSESTIRDLASLDEETDRDKIDAHVARLYELKKCDLALMCHATDRPSDEAA